MSSRARSRPSGATRAFAARWPPGLLFAFVLSAGCGDGVTKPEVRRLEAVSGDGQSGLVAEPLNELVSVRVTDDGDPAEAVSVTWSVATGGGSVEPNPAVSDAQGLARAQWTMGERAGQAALNARVTGASEVVFSAEALPGPPVRMGLRPRLVVLEVGSQQRVEAHLEDRFGNAVDPIQSTPVSRSEDVATASNDGTVTAWAVGTSFVVFAADEEVDSVAVAVVDPGGFAALLQPQPDDWRTNATRGAVIDLQLFLIGPVTGERNLAALQGSLTWDDSRAKYQSSGSREGGPVWVAHHDPSAPGVLSFATYAAEGRDRTFTAGVLSLRVPDPVAEAVTVPLHMAIQTAGTDSAVRITDRIVIVPSALEIVP